MTTNTPGHQWASYELHTLVQRRPELYPVGLEFHKGAWYLAHGPKHDLEVGSIQAQEMILERVNEILGRKDNPYTDFNAALTELEKQKPIRS